MCVAVDARDGQRAQSRARCRDAARRIRPAARLRGCRAGTRCCAPTPGANCSGCAGTRSSAALRPLVLGHGLAVKLLSPYRALTAHALVLNVPPARPRRDATGWRGGDAATLDAQAAAIDRVAGLRSRRAHAAAGRRVAGLGYGGIWTNGCSTTFRCSARPCYAEIHARPAPGHCSWPSLASPLPRSSSMEPRAQPMSSVPSRLFVFEAGPWALLLVLALLTPFTRTLVVMAVILLALDLYAYFTVFVAAAFADVRGHLPVQAVLRSRAGGRGRACRLPRRARERAELPEVARGHRHRRVAGPGRGARPRAARARLPRRRRRSRQRRPACRTELPVREGGPGAGIRHRCRAGSAVRRTGRGATRLRMPHQQRRRRHAGRRPRHDGVRRNRRVARGEPGRTRRAVQSLLPGLRGRCRRAPDHQRVVGRSEQRDAGDVQLLRRQGGPGNADARCSRRNSTASASARSPSARASSTRACRNSCARSRRKCCPAWRSSKDSTRAVSSLPPDTTARSSSTKVVVGPVEHGRTYTYQELAA